VIKKVLKNYKHYLKNFKKLIMKKIYGICVLGYFFISQNQNIVSLDNIMPSQLEEKQIQPKCDKNDQNFNKTDYMLTMIAQKIKSTNPEDRYFALYFLSNCEVNDVSQSLLLQVIDDQNPIVQSQIMWLLIKFVRSGRLVDVAFRYMVQQNNNQNYVLKMWSFEILRVLIECNYISDIRSILSMFDDNHELIQIQKMLLKSEIHNVKLDTQKYMSLITILLESSDENIRYTTIYLLQYLIDYSETHNFVKQILLQQEFDTPQMWQQSLWMIICFMRTNVFVDQNKNIAWKALYHEHWRVRFTGALLFSSLFSQQDDWEKQKSKLFTTLVDDENEWIKILFFAL